MIMGGLSTQENAPRRLSKPRTNSSTTNLLSTFSDHQTEAASSPLNSPDIDYFGDHAAVVSSQSERRSRRKSRSKIRAYLYGPNEEAIQNSSDDDEGRSVLAGTARNVKKRLSRTGSSIMQLQSAKASSAYLSKSDSQGSDPEETAMIAVQIKEKAHNDSLAAQNHINSPVDDKRHVDSVKAPVRRKSLYTPGIATRNASDILRKPPPSEASKSQTDHDYYYNPARPETSPLSQLAGLNLSEDGRATPSSINYPQLGGLLLGTLRVTNGIPRNDTPDLLRHTPTPESKTHEEYFTASEGSVIGNISATMTPSNLSPLQIQKELREIFKLDDGTVIPRESSIARHKKNDSATSKADEYIAELPGSPFSETPDSRQWSDHDISTDAQETVMPGAGVTGLQNWRQFIDDAGASSVGSRTAEDAFRKLNGHTQFISETGRLSVHSSTASRYSVSTIEAPKVDSGYSSNSSMHAAHLTLTANDHADRVGRTTSADPQRRSYDRSGPQVRPDSKPKQGNYMSQTTGTAPRSDSSDLMPRHVLPTSPVRLPSSPSSQTVESVRSSARSSARSSSQNLVRKLQKPRPKSQPPPVSCITVQRHRDPELASIPRVPSVIAARHADRLRQFPLLDHTFPSSQHTTVEERCSASAIQPMPVRFPSPANALEAATSDLCASPPLSDERKISRPRALSRYRSSLMFDEDEYPQLATVRSPSWSEFGGGKEKKERKKLAKEEKENEKRLLKEEKELAKRLEKNKKDLEKQIKKDESKQRASRSRSASRTRPKSSDGPPSQYDTLLTIANFGTVTESLSRSPYDITTTMFSSAPQNAGSKHPHQISTSMARARSMVGMDETAAAESARARSRARSQSSGRPRPLSGGSYGDDDGISGRRLRPHSMLVNDVPPVPALAAVDIRAHDLEWARSRRRSRSFSGVKIEIDDSFNDRGGLPGRSIRPSSLIVDVPPVPALPSIEQVKQREAQIIRSRPQSMIMEDSPTQALTLPPIDNVKPQNDGLSNTQTDSLTPRQAKVGNLMPRLWSKGSLEKKSPKAVENLRMGHDSNDASSNEDQSDKDNSIWEAQRQAWSQRRKSAGEALLKNRSNQDTVTKPMDLEGSYVHQQNNRPSFTQRLLATEPRRLHEPKQSSRPGPSPLAPSRKPPAPPPQISPQQQLYESESSSSPYTSDRPTSYIEPITQHPSRPKSRPLSGTITRQPRDRTQKSSPTARIVQTYSSFALPRKRISSSNSPPNSKFENLTGRYAGGLLYGYEPGCGLGGSAGTRSAKTEASRKSVDVSKGFGIDLSDVPIFVAPTSAK